MAFFIYYFVGKKRVQRCFASLLAILLLPLSARAEEKAASDRSLDALKKMSVQELMNLEVTSVSRRSEKLTEVASAVQVVTGDDIRHAGVTNIPDALRLVTNLQVAQANASQWAISARGFNNVLANKLLVMIDGRTVYTPLYAGVFWDVQDTLLEDVDRIEVISGPGGTLWGANAVNGVINIITKDAKDTQGTFIEAGAGNELHGFGGVRHGGQLAPHLFYRIYGKAFAQDDTLLLNGADANDDWHMQQGGLRLDWEPQERDLVTFQGDIYQGEPSPNGAATPAVVKGGNVLTRWTHTISENSDFQFQAYFDQTRRNFGGGLNENLNTFDFDWQHQFRLMSHHQIVWGLGQRTMNDDVTNAPLTAFRPGKKTLGLYSAFLQDEISLFAEQVRLTLGAKYEHNDYSGSELQPNGRLAWTVAKNQTLWAAVSRAVRTPSRIDRDFYLLANPSTTLITGNDSFESEDLLAYELGWRTQPTSGLTLSLATFYNEYDCLRSVEPGPPPSRFPVTIANGVEGESHGAELSATYQVTNWWHLRGGGAFFKKHLKMRPGSQDLNQASAESDDAERHLVLQSSMTLPGGFEFNPVIRYTSMLPKPYVPSYLGLDLKVAWHPSEQLELSVVGQNLLDNHHPEFFPSSPSRREIQRSVYGRIAWRY